MYAILLVDLRHVKQTAVYVLNIQVHVNEENINITQLQRR